MASRASVALRARVVTIAASVALVIALALPWVQRRYTMSGRSSPSIVSWDYQQWSGFDLAATSPLDDWQPVAWWAAIALVVATLALLGWAVVGDALVGPGLAAGLWIGAALVLLAGTFVMQAGGTTEVEVEGVSRISAFTSGIWLYRLLLLVGLVATVAERLLAGDERDGRLSDAGRRHVPGPRPMRE